MNQSAGKRATIIDIAQACGVSPKTVSRVMNNEPHVKEEVRQRVKAMAQQLHCHPNMMAQGLIARRSFLIGLTYERPSPSYVVDLQRGALEQLAGERYRLIVLPFKDATQDPAGLVALLRAAALDGVVLTPPSSDLEPVLDALDLAGIPYGRVAPQTFPGRGACAGMDDVSAAQSMAEHLIGLGHRRFGVIYGHKDHSASTARTQGYRQAFAAHGLDYSPVVEEQGEFTLESGVAAMRRILARGLAPSELPTALLVQNDDMALGAMMVGREAGLEFPRDMSIAGFDDAALASLTWPTLTTVRQPVEEMARVATEGLLRMLAGEPAPEPALLGHELKLRASSGVVTGAGACQPVRLGVA